MTLSYIEMVMLSMFGHSIYSMFCKGGVERWCSVVCVVCNVFVLSSKLWQMYQ